MSDSKILKKAIDKAKKNGYDNDMLGTYIHECLYAIIFSHSFAKAFWGEELLCYDCGEPVGSPMSVECIVIGTGTCSCSRQFENNLPAWQLHLRDMVLEENPIKYLEQFLGE